MTRIASIGRKSSGKTASARSKPFISKDYWTQSQLPLTSLAFLAIPIAIYELGTRVITHREIIAFRLITDFFNFLGATGPHLPALAIVAILLGMHIARNDRWRIQPRVIGYMAVESLVLAIPILCIGIIASRYLSHLPLSAEPAMAVGPSKLPLLILSFGAGIYEELVFRLIAFTLLHVVIVDLFKATKPLSSLLIVALPAILFSLYHYLGAEHFTLYSFVFRTLAGVYFGIVFLYRGFGVTAGTHAAYDVVIVLLS